MKKVLISGYYGMKNFGDDLFVHSGICGLEKIGFETKALSPKIKGIPASKVSINYDHYDENNKITSMRRFLSKTKTLLENNKVIYCGGSIYSDIGFTRRFQNNLMDVKKIRRGAISVSVGPFKSTIQEKKVEGILKTYEFLSLRDKKSFELVSQMNLPYTPILTTDIASTYTLPNTLLKDNYSNRIKSPSKGQVIGIALCSTKNMSKTEADLQYNYIETISQFMKNYECILKIFELNGHAANGDKEINRYLVSKLDDKNKIEYIPYSIGVDNILLELSLCDFVFCSRLHAGIMSYMLGVPFFLFEYHSKCRDFLDYVGSDTRYNHLRSNNDNIDTVYNALSKQPIYNVSPLEYKSIALESFKLVQKEFS